MVKCDLKTMTLGGKQTPPRVEIIELREASLRLLARQTTARLRFLAAVGSLGAALLNGGTTALIRLSANFRGHSLVTQGRQCFGLSRTGELVSFLFKKAFEYHWTQRRERIYRADRRTKRHMEWKQRPLNSRQQPSDEILQQECDYGKTTKT